ncbi:MAG: hypothetical protein HY660_15685 [Armatimonadetes bacterium]|nr:hypothetical protein [Armatimonadota bacterium]
MLAWSFARAWLAERLHQDEAGAAATEYVLIILGTALFLIAATFALRGVLTTAVTAISGWIGGVGPPP